MSEKPTTQVRQVALPVEWNVPPNAPGGYATELIIQRSENEYHLYFFSVQVPIILGGTIEQQDEILKKQLPIQANCISHIIVAANKMPEFLKVLETQFVPSTEKTDTDAKSEESNAPD